MNRFVIRAAHLGMLLAACSDVQSVQLGELAGSSAGASSAAHDAAASPPTLDTGTANAPTDDARMDAGAPDPTTPVRSPPSAADAGRDARVDDKDADDDDDDDSEESPAPERPRDDEDAGESSDD